MLDVNVYTLRKLVEQKMIEWNYKRLLMHYGRGDVFVVYKLDRLARSTKKLIEVYEQLVRLGVELVSVCDGLDTTTPTGRAMFKMIGSLLNWNER